jgi:hypothetical protein
VLVLYQPTIVGVVLRRHLPFIIVMLKDMALLNMVDDLQLLMNFYLWFGITHEHDGNTSMDSKEL